VCAGPRPSSGEELAKADGPFITLHNVRVLEDSLGAFAAHLRAFGEPHLAAAVEGARDGDPARLPQRVLSLFTHGMGGLVDQPLYVDGVLDQAATRRRDALAEEVHQAAVARLR